MRCLITLHLQSGSREDESWDSVHPLLVLQFRTQVHGMIPLAFRMGLPTAVKTLWKSSHREAQRCVSQVILNPIKLIVNIMCGSPSPWRPRGVELLVVYAIN